MRGCTITLGLLIAACASPAGEDPGLGQPTTFTDRGSYEVGVTTLSLSDRKIEIYYPAAAGSTVGKQQDVYLQTDPLPPMLKGMTARIPASVDLKVSIPAIRDVPGMQDRSFPLVIFSHGAGGWRAGHGQLLSGIASWGYVVASIDFPEYGFASFAGGGSRDMDARRAAASTAVTATLDLLQTTSQTKDGLLSGMMDMSRVAAMGHSAGGGTMFGEIDNPRVDVVIGWAPVPPQAPGPSGKPSLIIAAEIDSGIPVATLVSAYDKLSSPKRLAIIPRMGHNAFSDSCLSIQSGNDLISAVKQMGLPVPGPLLDLAQNGCRKTDLDTATGWSIIQHITVAELKATLGPSAGASSIPTELEERFGTAPFELREAK
jgi:dienelactone hydrolase